MARAAPAMRLTEPEFPPVPPGCCAVCRQQETGAGYAPPGRKRQTGAITWTCDAHIDLAKTVHHMPAETLNRLQWTALREAGEDVGKYLDSINKTDLATLTPEEFETALATVVWSYGENIARQLRAHAAPF